MKHVPFKVIPLVGPLGQKTELDYRAYIEVAVKNPLDQKSIGIDEMHKSNRILSIFHELANDVDGVNLEDADYDFLCQKVKALRFQWADPSFEQFVNDVLDAQKGQ